MKRILALTAVLASGCASGTKPGLGDDNTDPPKDAPMSPVDTSETFEDAPVDAPEQHIDAPVDAVVVPPDMPPDACVPVATNRLLNPALDLTPNGVNWTEVPIQNLPGGPYPIVTADGFMPQSAPNKAWLGGASGSDASPIANTLTDQLFQDVAIPANATQIVVSGFYVVGTTETDTTTVFDTFSMDITETNGSPIENILALDNTKAVGTYTPFTHTVTNLAGMAGKTIRLRATSTNDIINNSNFFLDTLALTVTACP